MKSFFILVKFYIYDFTTKKNINLYLSTNNKREKMKKKNDYIDVSFYCIYSAIEG